LVEFLKAGSSFRLEIVQQFRPLVVVGFPEQLQQPPALAARGRLFQRHLKEGRVPPTHFVVAVITEQARIIAHRQDLFARDLMHPRDDVGVPHIPPRCAGPHADGQHRYEGHVRVTASL